MSTEAAKIRIAFRERYGRDDARVYKAPGRVNLIGEHTDYNDGFVMPLAIDFYVFVAIAPRSDRKLVVYSENFDETVEINLDERNPLAEHHWSDYPRGVAVMLERAGHRLGGADLFIRGRVPIGAGLSSSAAIEVAVGYALLDLAGVSIDLVDLARTCQRAENEFVGMRCGLMDQFIACFGQRDSVLMLDCRSLEFKLLPLDQSDASLVICNTMVRHELAASAYNTRRAECEEGVRIAVRSLPDVHSLRDVTAEELTGLRDELPATIYKRCRHVVSENDRVVRSAGALEAADLRRFGELMYESHRSLRDDYEVSCAELDVMVDLARTQDGVFGARMTGGGFGGCTINLVQTQSVDSFRGEIQTNFKNATGIDAEIYVVKPASGVERVVAEATQQAYQ